MPLTTLLSAQIAKWYKAFYHSAICAFYHSAICADSRVVKGLSFMSSSAASQRASRTDAVPSPRLFLACGFLPSRSRMGGQQRPYKYVGAPFRAPAFRMAAPAGLQRRTHRHLLRCGRLGAPCWCSAQQARGRSRPAQQQPASVRRSSSAAAPAPPKVSMQRRAYPPHRPGPLPPPPPSLAGQGLLRSLRPSTGIRCG